MDLSIDGTYVGSGSSIYEFFRVGTLPDGRITLKSNHGHYLSAQPNGKIEVNRTKAQGWEAFRLEDGSSPVTDSDSRLSVRRTSDTDHAALLATWGRIGLKGSHGYFVSANATCKSKHLEESEMIGVLRIDHNVAAFRSRFGKYLSGERSDL